MPISLIKTSLLRGLLEARTALPLSLVSYFPALVSTVTPWPLLHHILPFFFLPYYVQCSLVLYGKFRPLNMEKTLRASIKLMGNMFLRALQSLSINLLGYRNLLEKKLCKKICQNNIAMGLPGRQHRARLYQSITTTRGRLNLISTPMHPVSVRMAHH